MRNWPPWKNMSKSRLPQPSLRPGGMQPSTRGAARRLLHTLAIVIGCLIGGLVNYHIAFNAGKEAMDFNQFYAASRLAGTGHLYDWAALRKLEAEHGPAIHSGRLPVVAYGVKILSWMPYPTAVSRG